MTDSIPGGTLVHVEVLDATDPDVNRRARTNVLGAFSSGDVAMLKALSAR